MERTTTHADPLATPHIRWLIARDLPEVLAIESACFPQHPWTENDFLVTLRQRNAIGVVIEIGTQVVGYMVYELHKYHLAILNLAVAPSHQGRGLGRRLHDKIASKTSQHRRRRVELVISERNLGGQLFFQACGWRATGAIRREAFENGDAGYVFEYLHPMPLAPLTDGTPEDMHLMFVSEY